jgi:uncharacterized membrane protein/Zn ribbon nucleic-acid-binding protein
MEQVSDMGKKHARAERNRNDGKGVAPAGGEATAPAGIPARDIPLTVVSLAGALLTFVMLWGLQVDDALPYCGAGSGCDVVQASPWSRFLGIPLVLWGCLTYLALGFVALNVKQAGHRTRYAFLLASTGFGVSLYLAAVSVFFIKAVCMYCMTSLGLMAAAFVLSLRGVRQQVTRTYRVAALGAPVVLALTMHASASGWFALTAPADPALAALATHLTERGARFYGASWCPHCQQQKALFGGAADQLPYVECAPHGPRGPRATECEMAEIKKYPTWRIDGRSIERVLMPSALARITAFDGELPAP